ncbi:conserved hypothetical protein, membrane [mine drainage metagenome]|uniref:Integral membrane protein n=1 Tax=mine drainage metagenome TaxID=410659 RepID=T0ZA59_9ZZZZ
MADPAAGAARGGLEPERRRGQLFQLFHRAHQSAGRPHVEPAAGVARIARRAPTVRSGFPHRRAANIALVGLTYSLLLRALWQPQGAQWLADTLLHDVVPLLYLLLWAWVVPRAALRGSSALRWALYPLAYLVYALLRGAWLGRYPYPFIDVAQLGYARVALNAAGMLIVFLLIAAGLIALNRLKPATAVSSP